MRVSFLLVAMGMTAVMPARAADPKQCIAAADQAQQARDDGKYRAARDAFLSCSQPGCPKMVAASCTKWGREIQDGMPTVVLAAKDPNGNDISDARVTFDGEALASTLDGKPVEVDPGSHKLHFEREGSEPVDQTVVIKAGEKLRAITVTMQRAHAEHVEPKPVETTSSNPNTPRTVVTVALGVLAVGAFTGGLVFAFASQGDASTAATLRSSMPSNACLGGSTTQPCQNLSSAVDAENRDGALSVAMYVSGGVLAAVAIVTWLAWPKPKSDSAVTARLLVGPAFAGIGGTF
jgi:hypothetical protein